ncbi:hypothetical protein C7974DRAFT_451785 [Boeremia exigua]|uniref:uncharacterized protein n=1 Tax=Boeremia exigua TaxID=749465 RepID=UPI001E8CC797|nr:uncharacterized protein C7974DRAFT_451785 [Boeremia exigua]KAH6638415.1 hypothetical protein C7974DRAFT_451785 [Boeremia exigua]
MPTKATSSKTVSAIVPALIDMLLVAWWSVFGGEISEREPEEWRRRERGTLVEASSLFGVSFDLLFSFCCLVCKNRPGRGSPGVDKETQARKRRRCEKDCAADAFIDTPALGFSDAGGCSYLACCNLGLRGFAEQLDGSHNSGRPAAPTWSVALAGKVHASVAVYVVGPIYACCFCADGARNITHFRRHTYVDTLSYTLFLPSPSNEDPAPIDYPARPTFRADYSLSRSETDTPRPLCAQAAVDWLPHHRASATNVRLVCGSLAGWSALRLGIELSDEHWVSACGGVCVVQRRMSGAWRAGVGTVKYFFGRCRSARDSSVTFVVCAWWKE